MEGWQVPPHPEQRAVEAQRRKRLWWGAAGAAVGLLVNAAILVFALGPGVLGGQQDDVVIGGLLVIVYSGLSSLVLLVTGGLLCIGRPVRPFGVGLLIGTGTGLISSNGVCFAVLVALT